VEFQVAWALHPSAGGRDRAVPDRAPFLWGMLSKAFEIEIFRSRRPGDEEARAVQEKAAS
jgi:hypothetical protein